MNTPRLLSLLLLFSTASAGCATMKTVGVSKESLAASGQIEIGKGLFDVGTLIAQLPSSEEQTIVRARPGLLPVMAVLTKLSADGSQNAAFCAVPRHP